MQDYMDTEKFIRDFQRGDQIAFNAVYEKYFSAIYVFCRKLVRQSDEAEDITTESFIKLFQYHDKIGSQAHIRGFLYVTSRNGCLRYFRDEKRKGAVTLDIERLLHDEDYIRLNDELDGLYLEALKAAFEKLPERSKELVHKLYIEGVDHQTAADQMKIKLETLYSLRSRTVRLLRQLLRAEIVVNGLMLLVFQFILHN